MKVRLWSIVVWRGNRFKTTDKKLVEKYRQRQYKQGLSLKGAQFPIKIKELKPLEI